MQPRSTAAAASAVMLLQSMLHLQSASAAPAQSSRGLALSRASVAAAAADSQLAAWLCAEANSRLPPGEAGWSAALIGSGEPARDTARVTLALAGGNRAGAVPGSTCGGLPDAPGSFLLHAQPSSSGRSTGAVQVVAADVIGLRAGAARLLREVHMPARHVGVASGGNEAARWNDSEITAPTGLCVRYDARTALWRTRGVMVHSFRTQPELERYARDLAVFGTNQLEMSFAEAELSTPSPAQLTSMVAFSETCRDAGMNVSIYAGSESAAGNRSAMAETLRRIPQLDSVFLPGGDGGQLVWPAIEMVTVALREAHPRAGTWVSAQMLDGNGLAQFWQNVSYAVAAGHLSGGVVYGPHVRVPLKAFVEKAETLGVRVRQYPDITHTFGDSFPVPDLHAAWSLTHERQCTSPMPRWAARIVKLRGNGSYPTVGVGAYSEGLDDDLNKVVWSAIAEDPRLTAETVTQQYARYHFGSAAQSVWTEALLSLEENWQGLPGSSNTAIPLSLALLRQATGGTAKIPTSDWRAQMYLKRGYFDAYVSARYTFEVEVCEAAALAALAASPHTGSKLAIEKATAALTQNNTNATTAGLRAEVIKLVSALNSSIGLSEVSNQDSTLGVGTMDTPLSDAAFLLARLQEISQIASEAARLSAITALVNHTDPGPGGFFDKLGGAQPELAPHLLPGEGYLNDPSFYFTPLSAGPSYRCLDSAHRLSWQTYAMSQFDGSSVSLLYDSLDRNKTYEAHVVFSTSADVNMNGYPNRVRLVAGGVHVWPISPWAPAPCPDPSDNSPCQFSVPPTPMAKTLVPIPRSVTANGSLTLTCSQPRGSGGGGRACQIAEVWLVVAGASSF